MAADQSLFSPSNQFSAATSTLITNEDEVVVMPPASPTALDHNAGAAAASSFTEFNLRRLHTALTGAHDSIDDGSVRESSRELNPSLNSPTSPVDHTSAHSCPTTHDVRCSPKRTLMDCAALQLQVTVPVVDNEQLELVALQDDDEEHCESSITRAYEMQSPCKELHASKEGSTALDEKEEEEREVDPEEEEEGCVTPTARDQRIPEYNVELNASGLVCPPAPRKKPNCASKRRRLFYSATDAGADVNYHVPAERRAFLVDPPDLHNFPDCIRALFK